MRFRRKRTEILEGDLTPMIDMTFQLIAFFMLIINFSEVEKSEEINLPMSELARPPEEPPPFKITLNLKSDGSVSHFENVISSIDVIRPILTREIRTARGQGIPVSEINVIIRADMDARTGDVQRLMNKCKAEQLENFSLRVIERLR
jgi:biopolymer transport protein ExbD